MHACVRRRCTVSSATQQWQMRCWQDELRIHEILKRWSWEYNEHLVRMEGRVPGWTAAEVAGAAAVEPPWRTRTDACCRRVSRCSPPRPAARDATVRQGMLQAAGRFHCQPLLKQMTSGGKQMTSGGKQATLSQNSSGTPASWVRAGEDQSAICTRDAEADAEACESHTGCQTGDLIQTPLYSSCLTTSYPISSNFWLWIALRLVAELHTGATFPCGICRSSAVTAQWR